MPVRHRQQHVRFKLLKRKTIFISYYFRRDNLGKSIRFGKRFIYTIFLGLAIKIFYNHLTAATKRTESKALRRPFIK
jgi:hypothetical protein